MYQTLHYIFTIVGWRGAWQLGIIFLAQTGVSFMSMLPILVLLPVVRLVLQPFTGLGKYGDFLPQFLRNSVEQYLFNTSLQDLMIVGIVLAVSLQVLQGILATVFNHLSSIFYVRKEVSLSNQFFQKFLTFDYGKSSDSAVILRKIQVGSRSLVAAMGNATGLVSALTTVAVPSITLVYIFPIAGLAGLLFMFSVSAILRQIVAPYIDKVANKQELYRVEEAASLADRFRAIKELKMLGREPHLANVFSEVAHTRAAKERALAFAGSAVNTLLSSLHYISILAGFFAALWADYPAEKIGTFMVAYALFSIKIGAGVNQIINAGIALRIQGSEIEPSYKLFMSLNAEASEIQIDHSPISFDRDICLENISFAYSGSKVPTLDNINLTIKRGEFVAVVGRNGSGKTTLIDVMAAYQFPQTGRLLVDGKPIEVSNAQVWHSHIGYIVQKPHVIGANVLQNVTIGIPDDQVDMERLYRAINVSRLDEVVAGLPGGLEAHIEYDAKNISGGQAQRIGIARALYNDSELLILDEATKSVDPITERDIMKNIVQQWKDRSIIMITHRMETLRFANKIVMLEKGKIIGEGDFDTLIAENAEFRNLIGPSH